MMLKLHIRSTRVNGIANIVIILADDLGYRDENLNLPGLKEFANPQVKTPCLASLPEQSLVFRHHNAAAPVCSPSRAGQLIGRTPTRCKIDLHINDLRDNVIVGDESSGVDGSGGSFWDKNSVFTNKDFGLAADPKVLDRCQGEAGGLAR